MPTVSKEHKHLNTLWICKFSLLEIIEEYEIHIVGAFSL